ncbi:MAG: RNA polymerase sigma factor [Candidatus Doudnabacteria bacterium]|nr:RNA polymerase sigma factor [Candidatus Doudnabacteria bacterium]
MTEQTDEDIAKAVQNGDSQAFGLLVERFEPKLMRYAKKFLFDYEDGKDMVQEIFIKAYSNIQSFDTVRSFSSWVYRIAHNEFINAIRKKGREPLSFFDPDTLFPHPTAPTQADDDLKKAETKEMVEKCLSKLDPKYREPLVLYYFEDMDYKSISEIMRIPVSTAAIRLKRGKASLQKIYESLNLKP